MVAFLQGPGFLGAHGTLGSDMSLIVALTATATLTVGWRLAVARRYGAHRWVQTAAVCLNLIPVVVWMIRNFVLYTLPEIPAQLGKQTYALTTIHAAVGAIGVALGVFVMIRANQLAARGQSLRRYKTPMRIAYAVYVLGTVLGVSVYYVVYVRA
jgi:uncharacterized membrane protein YozB (DUF420 family)